MPIKNFEKEPGFEYRIINKILDTDTGEYTERTLNRIKQLEKDGFSAIVQDVKTGINQKTIIMRKAIEKPKETEKQSEKQSEKDALDKEIKKLEQKINPTNKTTKKAKK